MHQAASRQLPLFETPESTGPLRADRPAVSPTDLNHFLECAHLLTLERQRTPADDRARDPHAELLARKGLEHEQAWLQRFAQEGRRIVSIESSGRERDWRADAQRTEAAMRAGADVIYQGVLRAPDEGAARGAADAQDEEWRGVSDFLVRIEQPSPLLGAWSYEAWDTKLARRARPHHILQLCFYTSEVGRIQGVMPLWMHVVLGTGTVETFQYAEFDAYYRAVRRRYRDAWASGRPTYPYPVRHCRVCDHASQCEARWEADDHLSLVAHIRRDQVERLNEAGITTVAALASVDPARAIGIGRPALERLRHQASLQDHHRRTGEHRYELLAIDEHSGFRLLPRPSDGDMFFDMEGDPFYEAGRPLEYLFGLVTGTPPPSGDERQGAREGATFRFFLALTPDEEKRAFEQFVDLVCDRLRTWPELHVYHYAAYEVTALKRLMSVHATREQELDDLLRREVFVDLYQVVRQSMRLSHRSYSIKKVRTFFMEGAGQGEVTDGGDSILQFERWRESGDAGILDAIIRYNEEDCESTRLLRDWLVERRAEAMWGPASAGPASASAGPAPGASPDIPWKAAGDPEARSPERVNEDAATALRRERLGAIANGRAPVILLADLLNYHRREAKPEWWAYFDRRRKSLDELMDDTQAIARLEEVAGVPPQPVKKSLVHTMRFPAQEFKLAADERSVEDPFRAAAAGSIEWIDAAHGRLGLKRGPRLAGAPLPSAIAAGAPVETKAQRLALARMADAVLEGASAQSGEDWFTRGVSGARYAAALDVLARSAPRIRGVHRGESIQTPDLARQSALVAALDSSYLLIQGPPGSGKTWTGARLALSLIASGHRIGIAATSHKAINNLLAEIERVASAERVSFRGLKKGDGEDAFAGAFIRDTTSNEECATAEVDLIAGTSWLFSREEMDGRLDYLFIDEAGQVALADALAMSGSARNLVLLGDPQQLAHVRQGVHPDIASDGAAAEQNRGISDRWTSGASVLEHLLGGSSTVGADRGIFLGVTWRMHPAVCSFVSTLSYDDRLVSAPGRERQRIDSRGLSGAGLRVVHVAHTGNSQQSPEEARAIAAEVAKLLNHGTVTDCNGQTRPLTPADILVVSPYNMQVRCLREELPEGVDVGTVDKFQGREAAVVFFSMASSSGEDVPRGLEFLFGRNRFNVAISRARAMAVVVCSPRLLDVTCRTVEQMRLVSAVCRFAEAAGA